MSRLLTTTPKNDGFRMPAEFEPHAGAWMIWPERTDNWREGARPAQHVYTQVAEAIARFEPVTMCASPRQLQNARRLLPPEVRVVEMITNDAWMRDVGPTFITNGREVRGIDWDFNAWGGLAGGLYSSWDQDDLVAQKVLDMEQLDRYKAPLVLEGGSVHVDGQGTLMTTEECLLHPNRNPGLTWQEIEVLLREYLGIERIIWLGQGVYNDETNGHIDNLACFIRPGLVALTWTDDPSDPQYEISQDAYRRLRTSTDARGREIQVCKIHQPDPILISQEESEGVDPVEGTYPRKPGDRMAASYINFYLCNGGAVVPVFGDRYDEEAVRSLQALMPERKIVPVPAREILLGGGNIHCITQQQPK
jgi:agmatine deiminase